MIFVKLRNDQGEIYGSYTDYWRLVELSGFPTCEQNEIDLSSDNTYVLAPPNGNAHEIARQPRRCRLICWSLERPTGGLDGFALPIYDAVWVSDRWLAAELTKYGVGNVRYVPVGGHPLLGGTPNSEKLWDFTAQAYIYGRRQALLERVLAGSWRCSPSCWGAERDRCLAQSFMGLCLHQDEIPLLEPLRATLFACWQLPLVYELCHDYYPYHIYHLNEIPIAIGDQREHVAANYRLLTTDLTFKRCVEAAA